MATSDCLINILGREAVVDSRQKILSYFQKPVEPGRLLAVSPKNTEEVQQILKFSHEENIPVFTTYDTYFNESIASFEKGILIDFKLMNNIEKIDKKNLMVHVQRGVTFEQAAEELKKHGMKLSPPAAATSRSLVEQAVSRSVSLRAARYPEITASNMKVVLPDGRVHLSGSHALSEESADHKGDPSANLSQWYWGADDIYGVVTRASIWAFPIWEVCMTYIFGFESFEKSLEFIQEVSRRELCTMAVVLNKNFFIQKVNVDNIGSASYIAAIGIEGHEKLASYRKRVVTGIASEKGAKDITSSVEGKTDIFQSPWYAFKQPRIGFFSLFSRITEFNNVVSSCVSAKEDIGFAAVSVSYGGCAWMEYTLPEGSKGFNKAEETALALFKKGAFFDRPTGKLAEAVYAKAGSSYVNHIKRIKNMVDPGHLINPGIPINLQ